MRIGILRHDRRPPLLATMVLLKALALRLITKCGVVNAGIAPGKKIRKAGEHPAAQRANDNASHRSLEEHKPENIAILIHEGQEVLLDLTKQGKLDSDKGDVQEELHVKEYHEPF